MNNYEKPVAILNEEIAEGVYMSSGDKSLKCDSVYMKGIYQAPNYSDWNGSERNYKEQFGCLGCPAFTAEGCGLLSHYPDSGSANSYTINEGQRKPSWEKKGYLPNETVSDWSM